MENTWPRRPSIIISSLPMLDNPNWSNDTSDLPMQDPDSTDYEFLSQPQLLPEYERPIPDDSGLKYLARLERILNPRANSKKKRKNRGKGATKQTRKIKKLR